MQQTEVSILALIGLNISLIMVIILGIRELVVRVKLARSGVKVVGHIIDHGNEGNYRNRKYYITYDYDYSGSTYSRKDRVPMLIYDYYVNEENRVAVSCLPENPEMARLGYKIPDSMVGQVILFLIGIAAVIFVLALLLVLVWFVYIVYSIYSGPPT